MNYDAWLVEPMLVAQGEADAFYDWCEGQDIDPESDEAQDAYDWFLDAMAEDAAETAHERRLEARYDDYDDRY